MTFTGKILVVDDEPHVRKFLGLVVRGLGSPTVIEASNGQEAVEKFAAELPDLVLLDVNMPVMDGRQALASIMEKNPAARVVMLTSLSNRETIESCLNAGAAGYLRKDTPKDAILSDLAAIVGDSPDKP